MKTNHKPPLSIYVHIPFCVQKCAYCDFVSSSIYDAERLYGIESYFECLKREIDLYSDILDTYSIETLYFGGGTPSAVDGSYIEAIIKRLRSITDVSNTAEITVEVNPGTLDVIKLKHYLSAGVNRISMGLQTTNDQLLTEIGRIHSTADFVKTYEMVKAQGIENISLDLMFGLPGQNLDDISHALKLVESLTPQHVSAYGLKLEEGTPLYRLASTGAVVLPDELLERQMYHQITIGLKEIGFDQYELSNYAKPGYESKHNLVYWQNKPYLGLGVSSHSKLGDKRFSNHLTIKTYIESLNTMKKPIDSVETIDSEEDLFETIMLGLRLNEGINLNQIGVRYTIDFLTEYQAVIEQLVKDQLLVMTDDHIKLTALGRDLANQVFVAFMKD